MNYSKTVGLGREKGWNILRLGGGGLGLVRGMSCEVRKWGEGFLVGRMSRLMGTGVQSMSQEIEARLSGSGCGKGEGGTKGALVGKWVWWWSNRS